MTFRPVEPAKVFHDGVLGLVLEPAGDVKTGEVASSQTATS